MKSIRSSAFAVVGVVLACGPSASNDSGGSGGGSSGSGSGSIGEASSSSGRAETSGTSVETSGVPGTSDGGSSTTGAQVPEACAAVGWDSSYATFRRRVEEAGGRYWYRVRHPVFGGGFSAHCYYATTVEVADGVVVRRILEEAELVPGGDPSECTEPPFDETGDEVGTHESSFAGDPLLFDVYYESCCEDILTLEPADEYDFSFSISDNGIVSRCSAHAHGCADGCTAGPEGFGSAQFELELGALPG